MYGRLLQGGFNMAFSKSPFSISQPVIEYLGLQRGNSVSSFIPEVGSQSPINATIPIWNNNFGYTTANDYSGATAPTIQSRQSPLVNYKTYELQPFEFGFQMSGWEAEQLKSMTLQAPYNTSLKGAGSRSAKKGSFDSQMFGLMIASLGNRYNVVNEQIVNEIIVDPTNYTAGVNVATMSTAIPSFGANDGGDLMGEISLGAEYLNKLTGGALISNDINEAPTIGDDYKLHIVIPRHIYQKFTAIWNTAFTGFTTLTGYNAKGIADNSATKGMIPSLFASATGYYGANVILAQTYVDNNILGELNVASDEFADMWSEDAIYMFVTSDNILKPASIMKPTWMPEEIYSQEFLGDMFVRTRAIYNYVNPIEKMFYKINLTSS